MNNKLKVTVFNPRYRVEDDVHLTEIEQAKEDYRVKITAFSKNEATCQIEKFIDNSFSYEAEYFGSLYELVECAIRGKRIKDDNA